MKITEEKVCCRANVCLDCFDGRPMSKIYPEGPEDDRTYDRRTDSVVCDACYIAMGQPLFEELDDLNGKVLQMQLTRKGNQ